MATRFATLRIFGILRNRFQYVIGIDGYFDHVNSYRTDFDIASGVEKSLRALYPNGSDNNQTSAFAYATKSWASGLVRLGARYSGSLIRIPTLELGEVTDKNQAVVFDFAASRQISEHLHAYSNVGTSYRSPNIDDLGTLGIVDFRFEVPEYGLQPEYSFNKEIGMKWKGGNSMLSLSVYHNSLSGLITRVKSSNDSLQGYPVYTKQNIGEAAVKGVEIDFQCNLTTKIQLRGGGFYTIGDNVSGNEPMRRIPPAMANFQASYRINSRFSLVAVVSAAKSQKRLAKGDIQDNRIGLSGTPGFFVGDLKCRYQKKTMYVDFAISNVGDQRYKTHGSGVYMSGRTFQIVIGL